ncbi:serine/arginine-rich splicing factor 4-like [Vigna umbellata]|uniref:serine/arginine-rich splicing factor 4-like n=1 Tax=Vigna umbellata TaxID=87088 RepID=UPI001F5F9EAD|nr:serine/arginine-rich splicing factor 4-like [Vigna umbellata]
MVILVLLVTHAHHTLEHGQIHQQRLARRMKGQRGDWKRKDFAARSQIHQQRLLTSTHLRKAPSKKQSRKRTRRCSRLVGSSESGGEVPMEAVDMLSKGKRVGNLRKEWERSHVHDKANQIRLNRTQPDPTQKEGKRREQTEEMRMKVEERRRGLYSLTKRAIRSLRETLSKPRTKNTTSFRHPLAEKQNKKPKTKNADPAPNRHHAAASSSLHEKRVSAIPAAIAAPSLLSHYTIVGSLAAPLRALSAIAHREKGEEERC